jgi:hypothetical protein
MTRSKKQPNDNPTAKQEDNVFTFTAPNWEDYRTIPALVAYLERIAAAHGLEIEQRNFKRFALYRPVGRYKRDYISVTIAADGTVVCPEGCEPTDEEAAGIRAAWAKVPLPKSVLATLRAAEDQRVALNCDKANWFVMVQNDAARDQVIMCQQRIDEQDGKKSYVPWTLWNDNKWRNMEPEGAGLPMWKPSLPAHPRERKRYNLFNRHSIMVHEGAKSARYVDWLLRDISSEAIAARTRHPWAQELTQYEHWGWNGGAANPQRADWQEIIKANPSEVIIVADNDLQGQQAVRPIARALQELSCAVMAVMFDNRFPSKFDLADEFPVEFWRAGHYCGPRMVDCLSPATWATQEIKGEKKGRPAHKLRRAFVQQWVVSEAPAVFINKYLPDRLLNEKEFNSTVQPFSEVKDTATLLRREFACHVKTIAYEPGDAGGVIIVDGVRCINTWTPTTALVRRGEDVAPWLAFMEHLFPIPADREYVLHWCATLIACPRNRMRYGQLLISRPQGVGKSTLMEKILAPLVGWQNVSIPSEKQLVDSDFNHWAVRKRLVLVHEIYAGQSKKAYTALQSTLTDDSIEAHIKYLMPFRIKNWTHFVLASNSEYAMRLVAGDRRWAVPKVTGNKKPEQYWIDFNDWLLRGGLECIHGWAYDYVENHSAISAAAEAPASKAKDHIIDVSRSEGQQMAYDLGAAISNSQEPLVVTDKAVREWVATTRGLEKSDPRLESPLTIRTELLNAGLQQVGEEQKTAGKRWRAYGNAAACKDTAKAPKQVIQEHGQGDITQLVTKLEAAAANAAPETQYPETM